MAKQYGNQLGNFSGPTSNTAPGVWAAGTEIFRQRGLATWPTSPQFLSLAALPGDYVYVASSGVSDPLIATNKFLIPSGQSVSTTTYSELHQNIQYNFGGSGTSFNLPNLFDTGYLKGAVTSGLTAPSVYGSGVIPTHTHSVTVSNAGGNGGTNSISGGGGGSQGSATVQTSFDGILDGNHGKRIYQVPLISLTAQPLPVGAISPLLCQESDISSVLSSQCLVASGQAISRTTYSALFNAIGTIYGSGDGSTTFNIPDLRGLFVTSPTSTLGLVNVSGTRTLASGFLRDGFASHRHSVVSQGVAGDCSGGPAGDQTSRSLMIAPQSGASSVGAADESRPKNITMIYTLVVTA